MIRFKCPGCGDILQAQPAAAGKNAKCTKCGAVMKIPAAAAKPTQRPTAQTKNPTSTKKSAPTEKSALKQPTAPRQTSPSLTQPQVQPAGGGGDGLFDNLPEFSAPSQPVPAPASDPIDSPLDFGAALAGATASIDAAVQQQLQKNAYAVGAKMTRQQIVASFGKQIDPIERSKSYGRSLKSVATKMLVLPAMFVLVVVVGTLVMAGLVISWLTSDGTGEILNPFIFFGVIAVCVFLLAAWIPVLNMIFAGFAIVFSGRGDRPGTQTMTRENQPVLYEFVDQICAKLDAPPPVRIDLNCDYNASASFDRGWLGMKRNELVLTLGVPLIASHSAEQLASVIAHEFGHFCQGGGMRAHYLIRNLNGWFINAAIEKTIRDEVNAHIISNSEHGAGFVWAISYVIGFMGRHMMWWFGYAGHSISGVLSREMEYDADKYAVHLAGTQAFNDSMTTVEKYGVAYAVTVDNLKMLFFDGIMINNIPRLLMHIGKTMPAAVVRKIAEAGVKEKEQAFDTHPPTRERLKSSNALAKAGIIRLGRPARDLVDHWTGLCENITLEFYSEVTGHKIGPDHVTNLEDILATEHKLLLDKD